LVINVPSQEDKNSFTKTSSKSQKKYTNKTLHNMFYVNSFFGGVSKRFLFMIV